jgi:hypothetical protein
VAARRWSSAQYTGREKWAAVNCILPRAALRSPCSARHGLRSGRQRQPPIAAAVRAVGNHGVLRDVTAGVAGLPAGNAGITCHAVLLPGRGGGRVHRCRWRRSARGRWGDRGAAAPSNRRLPGRARSATAGTGASAAPVRHPGCPRGGRRSPRTPAGRGRCQGAASVTGHDVRPGAAGRPQAAGCGAAGSGRLPPAMAGAHELPPCRRICAADARRRAGPGAHNPALARPPGRARFQARCRYRAGSRAGRHSLTPVRRRGRSPGPAGGRARADVG